MSDKKKRESSVFTDVPVFFIFAIKPNTGFIRLNIVCWLNNKY